MRLLFRIVVMLVFFGQAATMMAQSPERQPQRGDRVLLKGFVIDGGRVNRVEGDVRRISVSNQSAELESNQTLETGDTIQSAASGRVEILLTPGNYLRLGPNTRISLQDLSADNLKLKLWSGSAILELAINQMETSLDSVARNKELSYEPVSFLTPSAEYIVASGGCFRFDVDTHGDNKQHSELRVARGFAFVNGRRIDAGMTVSVAEGKAVVTSAAAVPDDAFHSWSRQRARSLVKANQSLSKMHWYKQLESDRAYIAIKDPQDAARAKERLTVSADNGVVVLAENALISRMPDPQWRQLQNGERLINGDRVRTAVESRAEVHVYPNCFFFLGSDTEIVYGETEGQVGVEMIKGSAIAILEPNPETTAPAVLTVVTDKLEHRLSEKGNYRINTMGVTKRSPDKAYDEILLKKLTGDSFDVWSLRRSKLPTIRGFARYFGPFGGAWYLVESTGEYTFVPARWEYSSPYGGSYSIRFAPETSFQRRPNSGLDRLNPPLGPRRCQSSPSVLLPCKVSP